MDIAGISSALSQASANLQVNVALTKIGLDMVEETANTMSDMMRTVSIDTNIGSRLDIKL
ncbi:MAG: hypothetical protein BEN19_06190 [Epulopiscium sp. Nuni2H_MBin003]|nr:MAG: hypothetical protein BEN19_06190 [Epulopiscium sp. Nuni2H_MBin003]